MSFLDKRGKNVGKYKSYKGKKLISINDPVQPSVDQNKLQTGSKLKMGAWHPKENTFAVAKYNSLFVYTEKRHSSGKKD